MNSKQTAFWGIRNMGAGAAMLCLFGLPYTYKLLEGMWVLTMIGVVFFWIGFVRVATSLVDKYLE